MSSNITYERRQHGYPSPNINMRDSRLDDDNMSKIHLEQLDPSRSKKFNLSHEESEEGWKHCVQTMSNFDQSMVDAWRDELNYLLVFAGLFTAVATAFSIATYPRLQTDFPERSAELLERITLQLSTFVPDGTSTNTPVPPIPPKEAAKPIDISINVFCFLSLIFSLAAAFFALMVQQWLRHYLDIPTTSNRVRAVMRQWRFDALHFWRVPDIIVGLSLLLQAAVFSFGWALLLFLSQIDPTVAWTIQAAAICFGLCFLLAIFLPSIFFSCPYKSPLAWAIIRIFSWTATILIMLYRVLSAIFYTLICQFQRGRDRQRHQAAWLVHPLRRSILPTWASMDISQIFQKSPAALDLAALIWTMGHTNAGLTQKVEKQLMTCILARFKPSEAAVAFLASTWGLPERKLQHGSPLTTVRIIIHRVLTNGGDFAWRMGSMLLLNAKQNPEAEKQNIPAQQASLELDHLAFIQNHVFIDSWPLDPPVMNFLAQAIEKVNQRSSSLAMQSAVNILHGYNLKQAKRGAAIPSEITASGDVDPVERDLTFLSAVAHWFPKGTAPPPNCHDRQSADGRSYEVSAIASIDYAALNLQHILPTQEYCQSLSQELYAIASHLNERLDDWHPKWHTDFQEWDMRCHLYWKAALQRLTRAIASLPDDLSPSQIELHEATDGLIRAYTRHVTIDRWNRGMHYYIYSEFTMKERESRSVFQNAATAIDRCIAQRLQDSHPQSGATLLKKDHQPHHPVTRWTYSPPAFPGRKRSSLMRSAPRREQDSRV